MPEIKMLPGFRRIKPGRFRKMNIPILIVEEEQEEEDFFPECLVPKSEFGDTIKDIHSNLWNIAYSILKHKGIDTEDLGFREMILKGLGVDILYG